jgi:hypothetical protein
MQHSILIDLNILVIVETAFSVSALAASLLTEANKPVRAMRGYLAVRAVNSLAVVIILLWPGEAPLFQAKPVLPAMLYSVWFWSYDFVLLFLEVRVAAAAIAFFFRDLSGIQALLRLASRWMAIAATIAILPFLAAMAANYGSGNYLHLFRRWWYAFAAVEMVPVVFATLAGVTRKVSWNSRSVAILAGLMFEPIVDLVTPWASTSRVSMLDFASISHEVACCAALALWTFAFLAPENPAPLARPTPAMLRLDDMAWMALPRHRRPVVEATALAQRGAQPWPKYRSDAWP